MTSRPERLAERITPTLFLLLAVGGALLLATPRAARADGGCKRDGQQCATNISCCSRACMKPTAKHGSALFGICCTPTTCAAQGKNCGTIPDGDCTGFTLNCGTCTAPQTCGGGGTANVCGCTPATTCPAGDNCGSVSDGCGGMLNCGTCMDPETCGGGGTPHVCGCTPATECPAGQNCGTAPNGCGGTLNCGTCGVTSVCDTTTGMCVACIPDGDRGCVSGTFGPECCSGVCGAGGICASTTTTTASTTTTTAPPTCANGGIACGSACGGACGGVCYGSTCLTTHCGSTQPVCARPVSAGQQCDADQQCLAGQICGADDPDVCNGDSGHNACVAECAE